MTSEEYIQKAAKELQAALEMPHECDETALIVGTIRDVLKRQASSTPGNVRHVANEIAQVFALRLDMAESPTQAEVDGMRDSVVAKIEGLLQYSSAAGA